MLRVAQSEFRSNGIGIRSGYPLAVAFSSANRVPLRRKMLSFGNGGTKPNASPGTALAETGPHPLFLAETVQANDLAAALGLVRRLVRARRGSWTF